MEEQNGRWYIRSTEDYIEIDKEGVELLTSPESIRNSDAGQAFMSHVTSYASEKGFSMKETADPKQQQNRPNGSELGYDPRPPKYDD